MKTRKMNIKIYTKEKLWQFIIMLHLSKEIMCKDFSFDSLSLFWELKIEINDFINLL
jgi:hypothetical protein